MVAAPAQLAISPTVGTAVHVVHAGLVLVGALIVLAMLSPLAARRRRTALAELRDAARAGTLVSRAELRAREADVSHNQRDRRSSVAIVAAASSLVAAGVHAAVGPEHFHEAARYGVFFVIASLAQTGWAVVIVRHPSNRWLGAGLLGSMAMVGLWTLTRTVGLPFGLATVEKVGVVDLVATLAELTTAAACIAGLGLVRRTAGSAFAASGRA